ncbi:hypothetical protein DFP73DRAFT_598804 [Morchella snyderi]|nr:hypothetical protein DFP73DRAFT_598804 [Morchella snyderi]
MANTERAGHLCPSAAHKTTCTAIGSNTEIDKINPGKRNRKARRAAAATEFESRNRAIVDITTAALSALGQPLTQNHTPVANRYNPPTQSTYQDSSFQQPPLQEPQNPVPDGISQALAENYTTQDSFYDSYVHPANSPVEFQENLSDSRSIATIPEANISEAAVAAIRARDQERRRRQRGYNSDRRNQGKQHKRRQSSRHTSPALSVTSSQRSESSFEFQSLSPVPQEEGVSHLQAPSGVSHRRGSSKYTPSLTHPTAELDRLDPEGSAAGDYPDIPSSPYPSANPEMATIPTAEDRRQATEALRTAAELMSLHSTRPPPAIKTNITSLKPDSFGYFNPTKIPDAEAAYRFIDSIQDGVTVYGELSTRAVLRRCVKGTIADNWYFGLAQEEKELLTTDTSHWVQLLRRDFMPRAAILEIDAQKEKFTYAQGRSASEYVTRKILLCKIAGITNENLQVEMIHKGLSEATELLLRGVRKQRRRGPSNTIETGGLEVDSKQAKYLGTLLADRTKRS